MKSTQSPDRLEKPHFSWVMVNIERKVGRTLTIVTSFILSGKNVCINVTELSSLGPENNGKATSV